MPVGYRDGAENGGTGTFGDFVYRPDEGEGRGWGAATESDPLTQAILAARSSRISQRERQSKVVPTQRQNNNVMFNGGRQGRSLSTSLSRQDAKVTPQMRMSAVGVDKFNSDAAYNIRALIGTARSHEGSRHWAISARTKIAPTKNKCNEFVGDALESVGRVRPQIPYTDFKGSVLKMRRDPSAKEWATKPIPGYSDPLPISMAKPGDIIAMGHFDDHDGHVGIVVGHNKVASANAKLDGTVTINDWGFRPAGENGEHRGDRPIVIRRWLGEQ